MFGKNLICFLIFIIICLYCIPVLGSDSVFVWSEGVITEPVSTANVVRK